MYAHVLFKRQNRKWLLGVLQRLVAKGLVQRTAAQAMLLVGLLKKGDIKVTANPSHAIIVLWHSLSVSISLNEPGAITGFLLQVVRRTLSLQLRC